MEPEMQRCSQLSTETQLHEKQADTFTFYFIFTLYIQDADTIVIIKLSWRYLQVNNILG